ncbi:hypothetical protein BU25DRAFT_421420 [Macroventuria anomochaeta]|uniref:Uncharacterized protein n=1 Tax=Macroventuria anomochaeta TaxID=301207 RepID=A0ACB6S103_9PLEO|nr:uncharacterized protein BU25DRAFT_421420 [Macroventuria anomochaeta]KAF2627915.1 hypothetical protein BU25DRAFT_421420 [Macroventuria anomochaeta]
MTDEAGGSAPPGIAALPPTTVRQIGSHQLLTYPTSVVKELIDNDLDARTKSIFVDITANTIDSIQVKDDGHGIPGEDRALACRRYCTSKIRDFHGLKEVGGKWLGFRGEALASIADMTGTVLATTRVEGEPVAVKLTYKRNGEFTSTECDSHPVGTTVKVTKLLESAKVREELAIKGSAKCLAKIRRLMQAYALARPAVRFRLHVLEAKNNKGDFVYAPKANANVEDAALKIIGTECALQCDFDSRPVSFNRGTLKKIATAVREKLRKANSTLANVKDPFFCLNIICPVDSYDPNIEPAKDEVIFGDKNFIIAMVDRLLVSYYPENANSANPTEETESKDLMVTQPTQISDVEEPLPRPQMSFSIHEDPPVEESDVSSSTAQQQQPHWRSSMYSLDEDLKFLQENVPDVDRHDAALSNPWTIARMNAPIKPKKPISNGQLLSPIKSQSDAFTAPRSPVPAATPHQSRPVEPLTSQTSSQANALSDRLNDELQQSFQRLPRPAPLDGSVFGHSPGPRMNRSPELPSFEERMPPDFVQTAPQAVSDALLAGSVAPRRNPRPQQSFNNKPFVQPAPQSNDTWFGLSMRNAAKASRPQKRPRQQGLSFHSNGDAFNLQMSLVLSAAERLVEARLTSENNTDNRDFLGLGRRASLDITSPARSSDPHPQHMAEQLRAYAEQDSSMRSSPCRPQSADLYRRSTGTAQEMDTLFQIHQGTLPGPASSPVRKTRSSDMTYAPQLAANTRLRRMIDGGLHRTKSSTLPLNFVPHGFETHNLALMTDTTVTSIMQQGRKLNRTANSLGWGYDSMDAFDVFDVFVTPISKRKIMDWVAKIDSMLHAVFERVDGVEVRGALHETVQRLFNARKQEEEKDNVRTVVTTDQHTLQSGAKSLFATALPHQN